MPAPVLSGVTGSVILNNPYVSEVFKDVARVCLHLPDLCPSRSLALHAELRMPEGNPRPFHDALELLPSCSYTRRPLPRFHFCSLSVFIGRLRGCVRLRATGPYPPS